MGSSKWNQPIPQQSLKDVDRSITPSTRSTDPLSPSTKASQYIRPMLLRDSAEDAFDPIAGKGSKWNPLLCRLLALGDAPLAGGAIRLQETVQLPCPYRRYQSCENAVQTLHRADHDSGLALFEL